MFIVAHLFGAFELDGSAVFSGDLRIDLYRATQSDFACSCDSALGSYRDEILLFPLVFGHGKADFTASENSGTLIQPNTVSLDTKRHGHFRR